MDITYARFHCTMHSSSSDPRVIKSPDLSFHFCLRLPQHSFDDTTGNVTLIANSPHAPTSSTTARALGACFAVISSDTNSAITFRSNEYLILCNTNSCANVLGKTTCSGSTEILNILFRICWWKRSQYVCTGIGIT